MKLFPTRFNETLEENVSSKPSSSTARNSVECWIFFSIFFPLTSYIEASCCLRAVEIVYIYNIVASSAKLYDDKACDVCGEEAKENGEKSRRLEYDEKCFACAFYGRRVVVVVFLAPTSMPGRKLEHFCQILHIMQRCCLSLDKSRTYTQSRLSWIQCSVPTPFTSKKKAAHTIFFICAFLILLWEKI